MMLVDQISTRRNGATPSKSDRNITATIGLVIHAAADGVALGAAATTSHKDVEMIVFLAIMLHKVPAAFGLVTFLLNESIGRKRIRLHLAIFSMVAPLLALITYCGIGAEQKEMLNSVNATGIVMLFSGGTFLYVATVHALPEMNSCGQHGNSAEGAYNHLEAPLNQVPTRNKSLKNGELAILNTGALLPLLLTMGKH